MKLPPLLVHILGFILRCGGKLDLTPGDLLEVIDLERSKYPFAKPKSGENCVLHYL